MKNIVITTGIPSPQETRENGFVMIKKANGINIQLKDGSVIVISGQNLEVTHYDTF